MASEVYQKLYAVTPAAATNTDSPVPGAGKAWIISRLNICNNNGNSGASDEFSILDKDGNNLAFEETMNNAQHDRWGGIVQGTGEKLTFWSLNGTITFVAYGSEVTY